MKLNANQINHRVGQLKILLGFKLAGLDPGDARQILQAAGAEFLPAKSEPGAEPADKTDMSDLILSAMREGLENNDPQMVRAALDWQAEHQGKEVLKALTVEIVPYHIADTSLEKIVQEADSDVIALVEAALAKRRQVALLPPPAP